MELPKRALGRKIVVYMGPFCRFHGSSQHHVPTGWLLLELSHLSPIMPRGASARACGVMGGGCILVWGQGITRRRDNTAE